MTRAVAFPDSEDARLDPDGPQRLAAAPEHSVWVGASAGSGKTKVLTDRVLRLLLPHEGNPEGADPHSIVCITFTKAGAGVMKMRIAATLSRWATATPEALEKALHRLLDAAPTAAQLRAARALFAIIADMPDGVPVMTIHAFCQSVLARFPLEAGLMPGFRVMDPVEAGALMAEAQTRALRHIRRQTASPDGDALRRLGLAISDDDFAGLLAALNTERTQLEKLLKQHFGPDGLQAALYQSLDLDPAATPESVQQDFCALDAPTEARLQDVIAVLINSGQKVEREGAGRLKTWLAQNHAARAATLPEFGDIFFTQKNTPRARFPSDKTQADHPHVAPAIAAIGARYQAMREKAAAAASARSTVDILRIGAAVCAEYGALKDRRGVLDYDDLITRTLALLRQSGMAGWVMYKLDRGIDHILLDEAQDTNPEQWAIVHALYDEFFSGVGARADVSRSVFAVGDEKQSIYGFQRAAPQIFHESRIRLHAAAKAAQKSSRDVPLNISFRSAPAILRAVDAVFAPEAMRKGLSHVPVRHHAYRNDQAGHVEIWPALETKKKDPADPWDPPLRVEETEDAVAALAAQIADTIRRWLDSGEILPARGRAIRPGDILILLRKRRIWMPALVRALRRRGLPVGGADRIVLSEEIAVQDLLALADFTLFPGDDLALAVLLRSPWIGWSEEQVFAVAHGREGRLWDMLRLQDNEEQRWLSGQICNARALRPFEFFSQALNTPCPADPRSGLRALRCRLGSAIAEPVDEFLSRALGASGAAALSLQGFVQEFRRSTGDIKRESEDAGECIRVMTVHGAKGLEAPIVILPDTAPLSARAGNRSADRLIWPDRSGFSLPLYMPVAGADFPVARQIRETRDRREDEEHRRLLYVAMTRAADRLYVGGVAGAARQEKNSGWYDYMRAGLDSLPDTERRPDGTLILHNPQKAAPDHPDTAMAPGPEAKAAALPEWLFRPSAAEAAPVHVLRPSESLPAGVAVAAAARHGELIHALLQHLPLFKPESRAQAAADILRRLAPDLDAAGAARIAAPVVSLMDDPRFAAVFGPGSLAEVPLAGGLDDGTRISGRIDRLCVTQDEILVVDYKTDRHPPAQSSDIPESYRRQIAAYAAVLARIYPGRSLRAALLWTETPVLMPIALNA